MDLFVDLFVDQVLDRFVDVLIDLVDDLVVDLFVDPFVDLVDDRIVDPVIDLFSFFLATPLWCCPGSQTQKETEARGGIALRVRPRRAPLPVPHRRATAQSWRSLAPPWHTPALAKVYCATATRYSTGARQREHDPGAPFPAATLERLLRPHSTCAGRPSPGGTHPCRLQFATCAGRVLQRGATALGHPGAC